MSLLAEIIARVPREILDTQDSQAITDALNIGRFRIDDTELFTALGIAKLFPILNGRPRAYGAEVAFRKIEAFKDFALASDDPEANVLGGILQRQMTFLNTKWMEIGSNEVAQIFGVLVGFGVIEPEEAAGFTNVAAVPNPAPEFDVRCALYHPVTGAFLA